MSLSGIDENPTQNRPILHEETSKPRNRSGDIRTKKTVSRGEERPPATTKPPEAEKASQDHDHHGQTFATPPKLKDHLQAEEPKPVGTSAGDTELYLVAGMRAAVVISIRVFLFRGAGKAN
jgi:hypothetical protein